MGELVGNGSSESDDVCARADRLRQHLRLVTVGESLEIERGQVHGDLCDQAGYISSAGLAAMFQSGTEVLARALQPEPAERSANERPIAFIAPSYLIRMPQTLRTGDDYRITAHILGFELSELHLLLRLHCGNDIQATATCETVLTCVTPDTHRVRPLPWQVHQHLLAITDAHRTLERPDYIGQGIAMRKRKS